MKLKRIIALIIVFAFALPCLNVSALFPYAKNSDDPFASFDLKREKAINEALSDYDGTKQKNSAELISSMSSVPDVKRVVKFKEEAGLDIIYDAVNGIGFELLANSSERAFSLYFTNEAEADYFRAEYESIIKSFEKDKYKRISAVTLNDELSSNYWAYDSSFAYEAWEYGFGSRDVIIAVLDSGIFRNHEDFDNTYIMDGYDAVTKKTGVNSDELGHGTKVTGIIAASPNNGKGISGIAPGCSILPINIVSDNQTVSSSDFASAVYFAVDSGAKIINLSIGGYDYVDIEAEAVKYANSKGCIVVSSSGNEGDKYQAGAYSYPASYDGVISVGACDGSGNICLFSQFNDKVTLAAPGTDLITLNRFNAYSYGIAGTSFSCAFVTGAAGLLLSKLGERRDVNGAMFKKLIETVSKTNYNIRAGWGILDIQSMLEFTEKAAVIGVKDGEIYFGNVSIWFINGSAVLDGKSIASGTLCKYSGKHNLELTYGEEKISVGFTTDNVPLSFDYKESSDGARIRFSRGKATLDGFPYSSGELVSRSGTHLFRITGPNGNTREYSFTLDFTAPEIAGVQDGRFYLGPRCISFAGAGKVTLNGNEIESGYVVSAPGEYRLVSSAKNGNDKKTVSFEIINNDKVKNYTLPAGINRIYVSEKNGIAVLYGDTVRTVYIYNISDMKTAKKILKLKGNVLECFEYGGKLAAVHESSISTFDIAELTV
ncbi:MAG: S8 family serine peptidase, partial [Clostridia bacterium]|nr:S8 family serine peptidase [Clostridia bacterium]